MNFGELFVAVVNTFSIFLFLFFLGGFLVIKCRPLCRRQRARWFSQSYFVSAIKFLRGSNINCEISCLSRKVSFFDQIKTFWNIKAVVVCAVCVNWMISCLTFAVITEVSAGYFLIFSLWCSNIHRLCVVLPKDYGLFTSWTLILLVCMKNIINNLKSTS